MLTTPLDDRRTSPEGLALLDRILALDPSWRISARDALLHDYFWVEPEAQKLKIGE